MNRTPQEILAAAAQNAGLNYVSKAEAEAGTPVPENQKTWMQTLKDAIAAEEHAGEISDVVVGENTTQENQEQVVVNAEAELETA